MEPSAEDLTAALGTDSEFWNQFVGSSSANVFTIVAVGLLLGLKKLCNRPSRCKSRIHCCCIDLDVQDKTIRSQPDLTDGAPPEEV
jgi:hypothetical protein